MNAGELIDYVRSLTGTEAATAHLLTMLNVAQDEVSRELRLPTNTVEYHDVGSTNDLALPDDARVEGVQEVYKLVKNDDGDVISSTRLQLYDMRSAAQFERGWAEVPAAKEARYVVYDPAQIAATLHPVPPPSATTLQHYRVLYAQVPDKMDSLGDQPFAGLFDSFHVILAYKVAHLISGDERWSRQYELRMNQANAGTRKPQAMIQNRMYRAHAWKGRR